MRTDPEETVASAPTAAPTEREAPVSADAVTTIMATTELPKNN